MSEKDAKKSDKKPIFKKWWFWVIIIVVLVAIGGGASNKNEPTKVGENSGSNVSNQEAEEKTDFAVGDVISYEGREVTVVSVERNYNSNNEFYQPVLVPMQSALNAWKIPTFADCFFIYAYLCYLKISDVKT